MPSEPVKCGDPSFPYNRHARYYEACTNCGHLAWIHAGSKPLTDVQNHMKWIYDGCPGDPPAPVVEPT